MLAAFDTEDLMMQLKHIDVTAEIGLAVESS